MNYRLGDVVWDTTPAGKHLSDYHVRKWPNSIAGRYATSRTRQGFTDWQLLDRITSENCGATNSQGRAVAHLRLGDVVCGNWDNDHRLRPPEASVFVETVNANVPPDMPIDIVAATNFSVSKNCSKQSKLYLHEVSKGLKNKGRQVNVIDNGNPDEDLCRMINADVFVRGKGGYSAIAAGVRKQRDAPVVDNLSKRVLTQKDKANGYTEEFLDRGKGESGVR
tara:strand:+ start:957 stop:1622 length:666 start_codon:yes stop_codon:yes gene_type:complete